jgi:hypothetical protein
MQSDLENVALVVDGVSEFVCLARLKLHGFAADAADLGVCPDFVTRTSGSS